MKRLLILVTMMCLTLVCLAMPALAEGTGYTVEFQYDGLEYVLPGGTSVAMSEILSTLGLTGEVTAVEISDTSLFSASNKSGEWIVTAHQAFDSTEWMRVTINDVVYEITVTDTTTSTITVGGTDYVLFTGFTATDGTAVNSAFVYGNAVDGSTSTSWHPQSSNTFVEFNTDDPIIPKGYIFNTYDADSFKPSGWALKAKANTEDNWTTLSSYSGQTLSSGQEFQYACGNDGNTKYKYFRFEASNSSNNIWLTEIRLYGFENLTYTHLTVREATCTEVGIKQECWKRSDGKYFSDENGTNELDESAVIEPMKAHTGVHHEADEDHIEYWQCSMCNKYFSNAACTTEITEAQMLVVRYLDGNGTLSTLNENATAVTSTTTSWSNGWYILYNDATIADRISVSGTVNLILGNGETLTASKGITVGSSATLNVYAQSDDEATMGALVASAENNSNNAAIGGVNNTNFGTIVINGGRITATTNSTCGAGIGGGYGSTDGNITINGGVVSATAGDYSHSAGIGGGNNGYVASVTLNGGIITATGDTHYGGAGIGTGSYASSGTMTVAIGSGVKKIVATRGSASDCIGKQPNSSTTVNVVFKNGNTTVTGDDKDAVFYDSGEGSVRQVRAKAMNHAVAMSDDLKANITLNTEYALEGETITLTLGTAVDASTLKVNDGTSDLTLTDAGNSQYTFTMPDGNVTVTVTVAQSYAVTLPANMGIVSATNAADGGGKYITGTTVNFKASFPYAASNVSDGTSTLEPDANGIYTVTVADADVTVTATVERSATIDLTDANGDFTAIDGDVLTGTTSGTLTIADGAGITLSGATITSSIVCEGTATITLVGTNSTTGKYGKAGIQIGGSGTTLTIRGDGTLTANGGEDAAGIGLNRAFNVTEDVVGGNIIINGGNITANGGGGGAGIGAGVTKDLNNSSSRKAIVGNITIAGGSVTAVGGSNADGIGAGQNNYNATIQIGTVTIYDAIDIVDASSIKDFASVVYMHGETNVTASKTDYFTISENGDRRIIVPKDDNDYTITIADGIEHGTLSVAAATAKYMQTVTVTATPAFGYRFVRLIVKDAQNNDVASTGNTFQMPKGGAIVSAVFEQGVHGTTEFTWVYSTGPNPQDQVRETIYDGVTTVNLQQIGQSYNILKYEEYTNSNFLLDNNTYDADIPYAGGTGEFYETGNGTSFMIPDNGQTGYYDITLTDVGGGKWGVSILPTPAQMDVVPDQTYTGSAITPEPLVLAGSLSLTKGTDYTYSYTNNTNVGTATVRATFQGDYASLGYVEQTFTITRKISISDNIEHGTVAADKVGADEGDTVNLTITSESGYAVNIVSYNDGSDHTIIADDTGAYKFTMPAANVTVTATFKQVHTVTFEIGDDSASGSMDPVTVDYGAEFTLPESTFTAPEGKTFSSWLVKIGDSDAVTMAAGDTITVTADSTVTAVWEEIAVPKFAGNDLELDSFLNLRFYLQVPAGFDATGADMTFSLNTRSVTRNWDNSTEYNDYRIFECPVYAYEMADEITAVFSYGNGETLTYQYSVQRYLNSIINDTRYDNIAKSRAQAVLTYGYYIQPYLAGIHDWTVGTDHTTVQTPAETISVDSAQTGVDDMGFTNLIYTQSTVTGAQYYLTINTGVDLNVTVVLKNEATNVSAMVNGVSVTPVYLGNNTWRMSKTGIAPNNMGPDSNGNQYPFVLYVDGTEVFSISASPMSYVKTMLNNSGDTTERNALAALYFYYNTVK